MRVRNGMAGPELSWRSTSPSERSGKRSLPEYLAYNYLGQAGINARILYDRVSPDM